MTTTKNGNGQLWWKALTIVLGVVASLLTVAVLAGIKTNSDDIKCLGDKHEADMRTVIEDHTTITHIQQDIVEVKNLLREINDKID